MLSKLAAQDKTVARHRSAAQICACRGNWGIDSITDGSSDRVRRDANRETGMLAAEQWMDALTGWNDPCNRMCGVRLRDVSAFRQGDPAIELLSPGGDQYQTLAGIALFQVD
jgi:hypothetical protein